MATKADPFPMLLAGVGFLFVYAGVKNQNPLTVAKSLAQGKNPSPNTAPTAPVNSSSFDTGGGSWGVATPAPASASAPGTFRGGTPPRASR